MTSSLSFAVAVLLATGVAAARPAGARAVVGVAVNVAPPARVEHVVVRPARVWIPGYWRRDGARRVRVAGYWTRARPGFHYVPAHWARARPVWRLRAGYGSR